MDDLPCSAYMGPIGAGNYVKMVHNGIEYGKTWDEIMIQECKRRQVKTKALMTWHEMTWYRMKLDQIRSGKVK